MRFAHLKTHHGFERLHLRGLSGAPDPFHLAAKPNGAPSRLFDSIGPFQTSAGFAARLLSLENCVPSWLWNDRDLFYGSRQTSKTSPPTG
jgi:hypothetical protein